MPLFGVQSIDPASTEGRLTVNCQCPNCKVLHTVEVLATELEAYRRGAFIQDAFARLSAEDRERMQTGYCAACQASIFKSEEEEDPERWDGLG